MSRIQKPPSVRRRYVTRAKTLVNDKAFLKRIADVRAAWNTAHPDYPVMGREIAPIAHGGELPDIGGVVFPVELDRAWRRMRRRAEAGGWDPGDPVFITRCNWEGIILRECRQHFPPRYYPNYLSGDLSHPAQAFISCCLVYDTKSTPPDLILVNSYAPRCHPFDPTVGATNPFIAALRARCSALEAALRETLGEESEQFATALRNADDAQLRAARAVQRPHRFDGDTVIGGWWYVPLLPEMTTKDWDNVRVEAIARVKRVHGENPIHDHIRALYREHMSAPKIAHLLGVTERHVWKVLGK